LTDSLVIVIILWHAITDENFSLRFGNELQGSFIRLRLNTLQFTAGLKGKANRAEAR
jgi:hypothetical protein